MSDSGIRERKSMLRVEMRRRLQQMEGAERSRRSDLIIGHLQRWIAGLPTVPQCFGAFLPTEREIDLSSFFASFHVNLPQALLVLPVMTGTDLQFREVVPGQVLEPGRAGFARAMGNIWEPTHGSILDPDVLLVPGAAFDLEGRRLGWGRGFYDRYLARNPRAIRVTACFDFQLGQPVPIDVWDQSVDVLIAERGVLLDRSPLRRVE